MMVAVTSFSVHAATFDVDMGDRDAPCGGYVPTGIGFVDCNTTMTGGLYVTAVTNISLGDTVRWTLRSTPHTVTSQTALNTGGQFATPCGTGDLFDSGIANAFTTGFVFTYTFNTLGTCTYYCILHPPTMQGQVNVSPPHNHLPTNESLTPVNISTEPSVQNFTAIYADPQGHSHIADTILVLSGIERGEVLHYNPQTDRFTFQGVGGDCRPGHPGTLSNNALTLDCNASSASGSGDILTVTYNLTPNLVPGAYRMIMAVSDQDGASSSKDMGYWILNRRPTAESVTPMNSATQAGMEQTFTSVYSDPDGYQNIAEASLYLAGGMHNEWLHYISAAHLFFIMGAPGVCTPGQATTLSNGFLTLDCANSSVSRSGNMLTVTFRVTPLGPSSGINYNIFLGVSDHAGAAHGAFGGTWQIP
jgi:plastocyanin